MAMRVKKEPDDWAGHFHGVVEACHFCGSTTLYWNEHTNNPVCQPCAKIHSVDELPDHGKAIRAEKRKKT